ncbi:hypothetical protein GCM10010191_12800 [Actinomadura vinacea]|uniref:Uncharacterized protein n=1 Tax=Actinomadura vinacea TaxID=115336 RepID=A0ABN3IJA5_9ACTN
MSLADQGVAGRPGVTREEVGDDASDGWQEHRYRYSGQERECTDQGEGRLLGDEANAQAEPGGTCEELCCYEYVVTSESISDDSGEDEQECRYRVARQNDRESLCSVAQTHHAPGEGKLAESHSGA